MRNILDPIRAHGARSGVALVLAVGLAACGFDKVTIPDEFEGPAELGIALRLEASPDVVTADGFSSSAIRATVRDQNGQPLSGRSVVFKITDANGRNADIGELTTSDGRRIRAAEATATSGSDGVARVTYYAPVRSDVTADTSVLVSARPVGTDANAAQERVVRIELRSAEPRLFPQIPGNTAPTCGFRVEVVSGGSTCTGATTCTIRRGSQTLFQSTASDLDGTIVRYEWFFGDDSSKQDKPDVNHVFNTVGTWTVYHIVTDNGGAASACSASITVN
jgi:hypothetical protein